MTIEKMDKVSNCLKNATPEQITKLAEDMAEKAPYLVPVQATQGDIRYIKRLVDIGHLSGLLSDKESIEYYEKFSERQRVIDA